MLTKVTLIWQGLDSDWTWCSSFAAGGNADFLQDVCKVAGGFLCMLCNTLIRNQSNLRRHFDDRHSGNAGFECPGCRRVYRSKNSLSSHIYRVHPELKGLEFERCRLPDQQT